MAWQAVKHQEICVGRMNELDYNKIPNSNENNIADLKPL